MFIFNIIKTRIFLSYFSCKQTSKALTSTSEDIIFFLIYPLHRALSCPFVRGQNAASFTKIIALVSGVLTF